MIPISKLKRILDEKDHLPKLEALCRSRREREREIEEILEGPDTMSPEELQMHCKRIEEGHLKDNAELASLAQESKRHWDNYTDEDEKDHDGNDHGDDDDDDGNDHGEVQTQIGIQKWEGGTKEDTPVKRPRTLKSKVTLAVAIVIFILIAIVIVVCFVLSPVDHWMPEYVSGSRLGKFQSAAVSTDAAPCAVIGKDILQRNGSAVDAAIAVLLCMGAVNPQSSGLGGGFLMLFYNRTEKTSHYINAREVAPAKAHGNMFQGNAILSQYGGLSIAVPGELAGYSLAHKRFGVLPWKELFPPTIDMCEKGIRVNAHLAQALQRYKMQIHMFENMRKIFVNNKTDEVYKQDEVFTRHDLARTLKIIAKENMNALYGSGSLAKTFLEDLKYAKSIIEKSDMLNYKPELREPILKSLRQNLTFYSSSLPGSGVMLAFMLGVLDGYPDLNPETTKTKQATVLALHRMIETFKFAYARRMELEDNDSKEMKEIMQELGSKEYADKIRQRIDDHNTHNVSYYGVNVTVKEDHGTAHVSIIAPNGDAVSVSTTVSLYFGSMVMSPSTGILLNNQMYTFSPTNHANNSPTEKNHVSPGRRPFSSMSPAIVVDGNGDVRMAVGGNGGTHITTCLTQTIVRNLWLGQNIKQAIDAPRFHHQLIPNYIEHEPRFPQNLLDELQKMGHELHPLKTDMLSIIVGIARGDDGYLYANSDYRKGGEVDGY